MSAAPKIGVMVVTPMKHWAGPQSFHPKFAEFLNELAEMSSDPKCPYEFQWATIDGGMVRARNKFTAAFLKTDCKWLLACDSDIEATGAMVLKLLGHKKPIVGALYCRRQEKAIWVANFMHEVELQKGGLLQVLECGTGLKLYHREVFENLQKVFPTIAYTERETGEKLWGYFQDCICATDLKPDGDHLTEDFFCDYLCRMARMGIWVDTEIKVKHRGPDGKLYPEKWPPIPGVD